MSQALVLYLLYWNHRKWLAIADTLSEEGVSTDLVDVSHSR